MKMDVDGDVDGQLLQQFLSMGTQDRDVLIAELQKLLGNQLNPAACAFFLDMNNWNLQAAVCSYYDFDQPNVGDIPSMTFVKDITIGEGESVRPGVNFLKTWRIRNSGHQMWPPGCSLKFTLGHQLGLTDRVMVDTLMPGTECDVSVTMVSPCTPGMYEGQWRMSTPTGTLFGDIIWVILQVSEDGLLDITQEMSRFGSGLGIPVSKSQDKEAYNPFSASNVSSMNSVANEHSTSLQSTTLNSPSHHGAASSLEAQSANSNHPEEEMQ